MGNFVLICLFAFFSWGVSSFVTRLCVLTARSGLQKWPSEDGRSGFGYRRAWNISLFLSTTLILSFFLAFGLKLPFLLESLFSSHEDVSSSLVALGMLASLCLSWLWSLNRIRNGLDEIYFPA